MIRQLLLAGVAVLGLTTQAMAFVIPTFDDLLTSPTFQVPTIYGGATWDGNAYAVDNTWYNQAYGNTVIFPTGSNAAFNGANAPGLGGNVQSITLTFSAPISDFTAEYATWAHNDTFDTYSATSVTVSGYNGFTLIDTATYTLDPTFVLQSTLFSSGVDSVVIAANASGTWFLMDVPEPATGLVLASAAVGLGVFRRRRRA